MFKFGSRVDRQTDFLGTFTQLQKVTFNFVMSVFLHGTTAFAGWIFIQFCTERMGGD